MERFGNKNPHLHKAGGTLYIIMKEETQKLIDEILLLPTFTYKNFEKGKKLKEAKVGIDLLDLHTLLNQFRENHRLNNPTKFAQV